MIKLKSWKLVVTLVGILIALTSLSMLLFAESPTADLDKKTFAYLRHIREEKKNHTLEYFKGIESSARALSKDTFMLQKFMQMHNGIPITGSQERTIDEYFISTYENFYDLLFVDSTGYVFHSIRQEEDYRKNLFDGKLNDTNLAKSLKSSRSTSFSDFEYYYPSDESAAFFIVPVYSKNQRIGWLILQCAINQVNKILTNHEQYGRTLEVYLVNNDDLMLTDSRFIDDHTILKLKVETESVRRAMMVRSGEELILDYRNERVYSSFEKFEYFNASWVIIAEIDEAEIITEHYKRHKKYFNDQILKSLVEMKHLPSLTDLHSQEMTRVDVNEWSKALPGEVLYTSGVSSCTAYSIQYPGEFAYLAHISAIDAVYGIDGLTKLILKDRSTNFVRELTKRVRFYDITLSELPRLEFMIIATHSKSFSLITEQLLDQGVELSNIRFIYNPEANRASVNIDISSNQTLIAWNNGSNTFIESAQNYQTLGAILKSTINSE